MGLTDREKKRLNALYRFSLACFVLAGCLAWTGMKLIDRGLARQVSEARHVQAHR